MNATVCIHEYDSESEMAEADQHSGHEQHSGKGSRRLSDVSESAQSSETSDGTGHGREDD